MADKDKLRVAAGKELLQILSTKKDDPSYASIYQHCSTLTEQQTTSVVTDQSTGSVQEVNAENYNRANGFGLYSPEEALPSFVLPQVDTLPFVVDLVRIKALCKAISKTLEENKEYRYTGYNYYSTYEVVLGEDDRYIRPLLRSGEDHYEKSMRKTAFSLDDYPLADEWKKIIQEHGMDDDFFFQAYLLPRIMATGYRSWVNLSHEESAPTTGSLTPNNEYNKLLQQARELRAFLLSLPYAYKTSEVLSLFMNEFSKDAFTLKYYQFGLWLTSLKKDEPAGKSSIQLLKEAATEKITSFFSHLGQPATEDALAPLSLLNNFQENSTDPNDPFATYTFMYDYIEILRKRSNTDEEFIAFFSMIYEWYKKTLQLKGETGPFQAEDIVRAHGLGLLTDATAVRYILETGEKDNNSKIRKLSSPESWKKLALLSPSFDKTRVALIQRIVELEIRRRDMVTETTAFASNVSYFEGMRHFASILEQSGKEPFERTVLSYHSNGFVKKEMLSRLLKVCHPAPGEDVATLRECLKGKTVTEQRLIDGAMFAPQWLKIVAEYLGWEGLESACWYFHAHSNEHFSSEKETMVARFSAIEPRDFNDGAFDIDWFNEAYTALGEERFAKVYAAAKYISSGGNHRRSQLFADAVTGKLNIRLAEEEVTQKRTKNYVLCYGLIPLKDGDKTADALHRYEVLQQFLKQSRQFGAQRRESEGRAVQIALENLSRNAGYTTPTRFIWSMEGQKIESVLRYFTPQTVADVSIWLELDDAGQSSIKVEKESKALKSIPAKLGKDSYVLEIKEVQKTLKDQRSRARLTLERAMESGEAFEADELQKLSQNPVIGPLLKNLVFKRGEALGFLNETLQDPTVGEIVIAHPVHLLASEKWAQFQRHLFEQQIQQPFKQIFRELYLPTEEELQSGNSNRYAGHQVQPAKGVALLKSRGWTVHYEEGLQKVYHKENLIVEIYAAADWFSPADIEAPTLETVYFYTRKENKNVAIKDIPPVLFSEVMRDIDLMVSVAHVGGVDPEASHSTVEMRRAIAEEAARLFRLDNVRFEGSRAFIKGSRAEYSVHLGSAQVYQMAQGALHVLAVPSQHRGKIFLPFVDEDPRTAEVITKILLFAEDGKIKDPSILQQLG